MHNLAMGSLIPGNAHDSNTLVCTPFWALESTFTSKSYVSLKKRGRADSVAVVFCICSAMHNVQDPSTYIVAQLALILIMVCPQHR